MNGSNLIEAKKKIFDKIEELEKLINQKTLSKVNKKGSSKKKKRDHRKENVVD